MGIKKAFLPLLVGLTMSCHGVTLEGNYEMDAPKSSSLAAIIGSAAGFTGAYSLLSGVGAPRHFSRMLGIRRGGNSLWRELSRHGLLAGLQLAAVVGGGFAGSYISTMKTRGDYKKYQSVLAGVLEIANSPLLLTPYEEFSTFISDKDHNVIAEDIVFFAEELAFGATSLEELVDATSEKTGKWHETLRVRIKDLLEGISLLVADLLQKKDMLTITEVVEEEPVEETEEEIVIS